MTRSQIYIEFIEWQNISIIDKGEQNDKQDKHGDQPIHIGSVDIPIGDSEGDT
jgi:hypothetical protein